MHLGIIEKQTRGCISCVYILHMLSKVCKLYLIFPEITIIYIGPDSMRLFSFNFFLLDSVKRIFSARVGLRIGRSRSSKAIDFGTSRKSVCDFLLVRHSNLGPILHRFRDNAGFLRMTSPYSALILGVFPLDQNAHVGVSPSITLNLKLNSREIIFKVCQPV